MAWIVQLPWYWIVLAPAAGIAATFNAPIAGALFAMEVLLKDLRVSEFTPIVVSAVIATAVGREMLGDELAFSLPAYALEMPWELGAYIVLGLLAGCWASSSSALSTRRRTSSIV